MPAQSTPYHGQATGSVNDLKEKATDQFEKIADKATDKFRDVAERVSGLVGNFLELIGCFLFEVIGRASGLAAIRRALRGHEMDSLLS